MKKFIFTFSLTILFFGGLTHKTYGQSNVIYYVPFPAQDLYNSFKTITDAGGATISGPLKSTISIVSSENQNVIIVDQWEDGYEPDILHPVQASTKIYGDEDISNGDASTFCPTCTGDNIDAGSILTLKNDIPMPRNPSVFLFDGRDKIASSRYISVSVACYPSNPGTVLADATEVTDTSAFDLEFYSPIGVNMATAVDNDMFNLCQMYIMASCNGTTVQIDADANGTFETTVNLNQGESYKVATVNVNAHILANKPVQCDLFTSRPGSGSNYENRWFTLYPNNLWDNSYYCPLTTTDASDPASVFLFNPSASSMTINYTTQTTSGTIVVPAKSTVRFDVPMGTGVRFYTNVLSQKFFAVGAMDTDPGNNSTHDWGMTLLPESYLTTSLLVGYGPGSSDGSQDGNPVWVIATAPTTIYVDYDGIPSTGALTDPNGNKYDVSYNLNAYESKRIFDPDKDQTGMRIYTIDGTRIAGAWGQDPASSGCCAPYLDEGTSIPPDLRLVISKVGTITYDANGNHLVDAGDSITYSIKLENFSLRARNVVTVTDNLSPYVSYASSTAKKMITYHALGTTTTTYIPDNPNPTTIFPIDEGGYDVGDLLGATKVELQYKVVANANVTTQPFVSNTITVTTAQGESFSTDARVPVNHSFVGCTMDFTNNAWGSIATYPINSPVYVSLNAGYMNADPGVAESVVAVVENTTTNDKENITLTETGVNTGIFRGSLSASTSAGGSNFDGTLKAIAGDNITVTYNNSFYDNTCSDNALVGTPILIKQLYLTDSPSSKSMNRNIPSGATISTAVLGGGTSGSITLYPVADALITKQQPTNNYGSDQTICSENATSLTRALFRFDLTPYAGANITSATLTLRRFDSQPTGIALGIYSVTNPWTEGTGSDPSGIALSDASINASSNTNDVTWNNRTTGTAWTTAGGDFNSTVIASGNPTAAADFTWSGTLATTVQNWVNNSATNYGLMLKNVTETGGAAPAAATRFDFRSKEYGTAAQRPRLAINYTFPGLLTATFSQNPSMCSNLTLPTSGLVKVKVWIGNITGTMPANPSITATLKNNGVSFLTLSAPVFYDNAGTANDTLVFTGPLVSTQTVLAGTAVSCDITTAQAGVTFTIDYNSSTKPSRIDLPTTTVINVNNVAVYDAAYPGGSIITTAFNGSTAYVRTVVSDPFGSSDITSMPVSITGPASYSLSGTATSVATSGCTRTYEYVWTTPTVEGNYYIDVTAKEGSENTISDTKSTIFNLKQSDLGTPCASGFTDVSWNPVTTYAANGTIYVQVTDADQNLNSGSPDNFLVTINAIPNGDIETFTLTETGNATGIFRGSINSNAAADSPGVVYAPIGTVMHLLYKDPNDAADVCNSNASIPLPIPDINGMVITKTRTSSAIANIGEQVNYTISITNVGNQNITQLTLTDTYPSGNLSYVSSSVAPTTNVSGTLTWTGLIPISVGQTKTIDLVFTALASGIPVTNTAVTSNGLYSGGGSLNNKTATANVNITNPDYTIVKSLILPASGAACLGANIQFQVHITNTGNTNITNLPMSDAYSNYGMTYVSATPVPTGIGGGMIFWSNLASVPITPGNSLNVIVNLTAANYCGSQINSATIIGANDVNGDALPDKSSDATIIIDDLSLPIIVSCPPNINVNVDPGSCFATGISLGSITPSDNCGITNITNDAPVAFPAGTTTVTWSAIDAKGNTSTCTQTVIVNDNINPTITCAVPFASYNTDPGHCYYSVPDNGLDPISTTDNCSIASVKNNFTNTSTLNGAHFPIGTTTVIWTVKDPTGNSATCQYDIVVANIPGPVVGTITQPTCALAIGSVSLSGLPEGNWTLNPGSIAGNTTTAVISGLATGTHNFTVTLAEGCTTLPSANVDINAQPLPPSAATASTTIQPTCALAIGTIVVTAPLGAYEYNIDGGAYQASVTFAGVSAGSHNILVRSTADNTCISGPTSVTVNAQSSPPSAATASTTIQPTCALATGTIVVTAPLGAYQYNIDGDAYQASVTFAGVSAGSHNILVRRTADNTCISGPTSLTVNAQPSPPASATASTTIQPTCALATGTIIVIAPLGAYQYNIDGGTYQASITFAGVSAVSHNILVRSTADNTCISGPTSVTVNVQPSPPASATASTTIQPTCTLATGTIVVTAPLGAYQYNIDGGAYQASVTFAGVSAGSHNILVRSTADNTCISGPTSVTVNAQPSPPASATASTTIQPTCALSTGTIVVTAPLGAYQYNIDGGAYQVSVTFLGVSAGSHNILVRRTADNTCISGSTSVTVNAQPSPPSDATASTTIQPTCALATGTIVVTVPLGAYEYNIDGGSYQASVTFSGVSAGSHNILIRRTADNTCISGPTSVIVYAQPSPPASATASTTIQPTCALATGTIVVTAPLGAYEYNIDDGAYQASVTFAGVAAGSHNILVRRTPDNTCISGPTSVTVNTQPSPSSAAIASTTIQPTCALATGTIVVTAPLGAYEYNIDGGAYQASVTFAGIAAGSHTILVRRTADNTCISGPTSVTVNAQPSPPSAATASTTIQPTCALATGTIVVTAPLGAYEYNIYGGTYQASVTFAGVTAGSHTILVRSTADNTCISGPTSVTVIAQPSPPSAATASTTIQPTCALATGTIVVTAPLGAYQYNIDGGAYQASVTFTGVSAGSHNILVRSTADNTCISGPTSLSVNAQPPVPTSPIIGSIAQPTCPLYSGSADIIGLPAGNWILNPGGITGNTGGTIVTGLAPGTYNFTVTDALGCISSPSGNAVINAIPICLPIAINDINSTNEDTPVNGDVSTNDIPSADGGNVWSLAGVNGGAVNGTVTMNNNATYTYTPNANYNGSDVFTYHVCDVDNDCSTATVTITINAVNDQPVAVNDVTTTNEDIPLSGDVSTNDTPSGDGGNIWSLIGINGGATNGTVTMNNNGTYTYTPNANYNGSDVFTYHVCDVDNDCSTATVTITIIAINYLPVAVNDINTTNEDTSVSGDVSLNDTPSLDGGNVWSLLDVNGGAANGTVTMNINGTYTYTPNANYNGSDVFTYHVCDVDNDCSTAIVTITINAVNDLPIAVNDINSTNEDTPVNGDVSTNDTPSGDGGNIWSIIGINGGAINGTVTMNNNGTYTYTPNANYNGSDVFTYHVCDVDNDCSTATVTITIIAVNYLPVALNDINTTNEDTPVNGDVTTNDTPSMDGSNVWSLVGVNGGALYGAVTMNNDGTYTYTPNANYNGSDVFTYHVCDVDNDCSTATVTITIIAVNYLPVAVNDINTTNEDTPVSGDVSLNDTPSLDGGNVWSLLGVNGGATNGTVTMNNNGTYIYTPNGNYNGSDVFTYHLCDVDNDCSTATVTITINAVNDQPVAVNDVTTTNEDILLSGDVSTNDTPSGDGGNIWSLIGVNGGAINGTVTMNNDGTYTYTPNANYNGSDVFTYHVCDVDNDCSTATVTITVIGINDPPVLSPVFDSTMEDVVKNICLSITDPDTNSVFTVSINNLPSNGTITSGPTVAGNKVFFTYTPDPNFNGVDSISIIVCDNSGLCDTAVAVIMVFPVNDPPVADPDYFTTNEDTPITGSIITNDIDVDGNINPNSYIIVSGVSNGSLNFNNNGTFTYTPNANYNGTDSFIYSVCDLGIPVYCDTAIVHINIIPVDDPPIIAEPNAITQENNPVSVCTMIFDPDAANTFTTSLCSLPSNGIITFGPTVVGSQVCFTYLPNPGFNGSDNVCIIICDNTGLCDTSTSAIMVLPVNDPPVANPDNFSTNEDTPLTAIVITNDSDADGNLNPNGYALVSYPSNGTLLFNNNGTFTYTPDPNYNGTDSFIYSVCDLGLPVYCDTALVTITVVPVNDPPIAVDDFAMTPEDTPASGNVLSNDSDPEGDPLVLIDFKVNGTTYPGNSSVTIPGVGILILNSDGSYTFTPDSNYNGSVPTITYTISDGNGGTDTANLNIFVGMVNDPPLAVNDTIITLEDTAVIGNALTNDSDIDGDPLTVVSFIANGITYPAGVIVNISGYGIISIYSNGLYNFNPAPDFNGFVLSIPYTITDGNGGLATADIIIIVTPVDDPPAISEPVAITAEDTPVTVYATISDPDTGNTFTASLCGPPANGTITSGPTIIGNQVCFTYLPNANFNGTDNVCVIVCDNTGLGDTSVSIITVVPVNDPPVANPDNLSTNEDTPVTATVITNDNDIDGNLNPNGYAVVTYPTHGTLVFSGNGTFTYTPNSNYNGTDSFIYSVCDLGTPVYCDTAIVNIEIIPVNDAPVAINEQLSLCEGSSNSINVLTNGDFDPEGSPVAVDTLLIFGPMHGNAVITPDGTLTYTPFAGYFGSDYIVVSVCDQGIPSPSACSNDTIFINVDQSVIAFAGNDQEFCTANMDFITLNGNPVLNGNVQWTQISGPVALIFSANSSSAAAYINHVPGTYVFDYTVTNGTCTASDQVSYIVWLLPTIADAGPDQNLCAENSTIISANTPIVGTGLWAQVSGPNPAIILNPNSPTTTLMGLTPGTYVLSWTITNGPFCSPSVDQLIITINSPATVFAGPNDTICEGSDYFLSNATSTNAASVHWTTSGTGLFSDSNILNPIYTPSPNDILDGYVDLTLNTNTNSTCPNIAGSMTLFISHSDAVNAGPDATICETDGPFIINGSTSQYATSNQWSTSGTGAFLNGTSLHPVYIPSPADITAGTVTLTLDAASSLPCPDATDAMILTINRQAIVNAGSDATICESDTYSLNNATSQNADSYLWTTSGTGTFNNNILLNPEYAPSMNDILDGHVNLTLTATSTSPCSNVSGIMTLTISHQAIVNAGPDVTICETQGSYTLSGSSAQNAVSYQWNTNGSGTFTDPNSLHPVYSPSPADISAGSVMLTVTANSNFPCPHVTDTMILNISHQAIIDAGSDNSICETGTYMINTASAQYASSLHWTTTGTGIFSNSNTLSPVYAPSQNDITDGWVYLVLTATSAGPCAAVSDTLKLNIMHQANNVFAGTDALICETGTYTISDATANNAASVLWTTSGTGTFNNNSLLHPTYDPSPADIAMGSVILTLTASSVAPCTSVSDDMTLNFSLSATSSAGPDDVVCEGSPYTLTGATAANAASYVWSTNGSGTFNDPNILNATYNPSPADILNGQIILTFNATSNAPCGNAPSDAMKLTISHKPVIYAGADTAICQNVTYHVDDATALYTAGLFWSTTGTGTILNGGTLNPTYFPGPGETGAIRLTLNAINSFACGSDTTMDFMYLTIMQSVIANAGQDTTIFANNSVALHGSAIQGSGAYSYNWQPALLLIYENTDHPITNPLANTTVFIVTVTDLVTGCQNIDSVVVTVDGINLPPVAVDDYDTTEYQTCLTFPILLNDYDPENTSLTVSLCGPPIHGIVVINSDNTLTYCPYDGFSGDDTLCYQICDHGSPVMCSQAKVYIHVKPEFTLDDLVIYNGVSPNGDGDNDVWIIDGIQFFPDNEVTIFNRWGDVVANYTHYNNKDIAWDATYKGKIVPDGTYYYMLDIKNKKKFSGWIYVKIGK